MIAFIGTSHAAQHLKEAAIAKGVRVLDDPKQADIVFVSEDTPTDERGHRDLYPIFVLLGEALDTKKPIVLTSQVPPGFTREFHVKGVQIYHQAETLRIKDAKERAAAPDYIAVGCPTYQTYELLPLPYREYLEAFNCPIHMMTYEDAEFSKIAVNMTLAAQVENTNRLAEAARLCGATWWHVSKALASDKRIGEHSYLQPGRWQDSKHLLRDAVTLEGILAR